MNRLLRYFKFNVVGAMGMGVQLGVLWLVHRLSSGHFLLGTFFAVEAAVVHNFFWHLRFTWRDREDAAGRARMFWRFQLSNGVVSAVGNLALIVGVRAGCAIAGAGCELCRDCLLLDGKLLAG